MLAATERTETILLYQSAVLIVALALPTIWFWTHPTPGQWFWIAILGLFVTIGLDRMLRA